MVECGNLIFVWRRSFLGRRGKHEKASKVPSEEDTEEESVPGMSLVGPPHVAVPSTTQSATRVDFARSPPKVGVQHLLSADPGQQTLRGSDLALLLASEISHQERVCPRTRAGALSSSRKWHAGCRQPAGNADSPPELSMAKVRAQSQLSQN